MTVVSENRADESRWNGLTWIALAVSVMLAGPLMLAGNCLIGGCVLAQAKDSPPAAPAGAPLPQRGSLASTTDRGYGTQSSPSQWGGLELEGKNAPPVSASVARGKRSNWELKVFNNSEDIYTVTIALDQLGSSGGKVKTDSFTFSLKAGAHQTRSVPASASSTGAAATLVSWKREVKRVPATATPAVAEGTPPAKRVMPAAPTPMSLGVRPQQEPWR
ncbi:MAG: hypothetical protein EBZ48_02725 [Proteobacteria bacterium]|nr:hypothetical protein [Pseudomonadota bacterium]